MSVTGIVEPAWALIRPTGALTVLDPVRVHQDFAMVDLVRDLPAGPRVNVPDVPAMRSASR